MKTTTLLAALVLAVAVPTSALEGGDPTFAELLLIELRKHIASDVVEDLDRRLPSLPLEEKAAILQTYLIDKLSKETMLRCNGHLSVFAAGAATAQTRAAIARDCPTLRRTFAARF